MPAINEIQWRDEMMATAIALAMPADSLFWKRAHPDFSPKRIQCRYRT